MEEMNVVERVVEKLVEVQAKHIDIDFSGVKLFGDNIQDFLSDYAKYFGEVENAKLSANNPFFKSKYAPLSEILDTVSPVMSKYGLAVIQIPAMDGDLVKVNNILTHKSGCYMTIEGISAKPAKLGDPQALGSVVTYLRRYTMSAIANISSDEDDDGNAGSGNSPNKKEEVKKEDLSKATLAQLKTKINALAKQKMEQHGAEKIQGVISDKLKKKLAEATDADKQNMIELHEILSNM